MSKYKKKIVVSLQPESEALVEEIKSKMFQNETKAFVYRHIIRLGLAVSNAEVDNLRDLNTQETD